MRQLTLGNQHKDLQTGDLIAVGVGGQVYVGVYSQLTKKNVVRFIRIDADLSKGELLYKLNKQNLWEAEELPYTYERRFRIEWSRRQGSWTGYGQNTTFNNSSFVPYHVDLLTEEQKENYHKIREFLRCTD